MKGKLIKGKDMSEEMKQIVLDVTGAFDHNDLHFVVATPTGLCIYDVDECIDCKCWQRACGCKTPEKLAKELERIRKNTKASRAELKKIEKIII